MKKISLVCIYFFMSQSLLAMPSQILLMRHAEKPDSGNELSEQGWQRARLLPNLFTSRQEFKTFGLPAALYAMSPKKDDGSIRSIQTLKYVSEQFSIPIEKQFNRGQIKELVVKIKNEKKFNGKMVVICWEHKELVYIAGELGFSNLKDWPSKQYDRVWTFNFASDGTPVHFDNIPEKLLLSDSKD